MNKEDLKVLMARFNIKPNKLLGQNFLIDDLVMQKIIDAAELQPDDQVLEIGSGIGNLTKLLIEKAQFVLAVEKDKIFFELLKILLRPKLIIDIESKMQGSVMLVHDDIMRFNFQKVLSSEYKVVANIPYYITGKIIEMLLTAGQKPTAIILLVQKEVAERIVSVPDDMSVLSIAVQLYGQPEIVSVVQKEKFYPQPKVDSAILKITVFKQPRFDVDQKIFFKIVKSCFAGKRKKLRNTLKNNLGFNEGQLKSLSKDFGLDLNFRPQNLSLQDWKLIHDYFAKL